MLDDSPATDIGDVAGALEGARVLVTGGTGSIGRRLVERLVIECGAKPRVMLRSYARAASLARFGRGHIELITGSLTDPGSLHRAVEGCSIVFHCAIDLSDWQSNIVGTKALIDACVERKARLVHVSSFAIYEPLKHGDLDESMVPVRSGNPYSEMKIDLENEVLEAVASRGLDGCIVLPTIVYGPYCRDWTLFPARQLASGTLVLPDLGEGLCNAVYIDDVCQGMIRAGVVPAARSRRYLISAAEPVRRAAFYESLADALGRPGPKLVTTSELERQMSNPVSVAKLLLGDPRQISRWGPMRHLAAWAKTSIGPSGKARLKQLYGVYRRHAPAPVYAPSAQLTALYSARCRVIIDRARTELGYQPAYDFKRGSLITSEWLRWAMPATRA